MSEEPEASRTVKVEEVYARVKARVAERIRSGVYSEGEVEEVRRMELSLQEHRDLGVDVDRGIAYLNANWDPTIPVPISSHRPLLGRILVPAKQALRRLVRPLASLMLGKQTEFNGQVAHLLTAALHNQQGMESWLRRVEHRLDLAETRLTIRETGFEELLAKYLELAKEQEGLLRRQGDLAAEFERTRSLAQAARRAVPAAPPAVSPGQPPAAGPPAESGAPDFPYLAFEERHRGSSADLKEQQRAYLPRFEGSRNVVDMGCGRGEFLELLREAGVEAYGVDLDPEMTALCRERGLRAETGDLIAHLAGLPDGSLGGIFAAQVVEHLDTPRLLRFIQLAHAKLAPGGRLVAETINPACLATFAGAFYLDLTHTRPIHPEALRFALEAAGFNPVEVVFRSPFPREAKLKEVDVFHRLQKFEDALLNVVNDNFNQLNELIYGYQDYAVVGTR